MLLNTNHVIDEEAEVSLQSIDSKTPALSSGNVPVVEANSAAIETILTTQETHLASLDSKLTNPLPVSATALPLPVNASKESGGNLDTIAAGTTYLATHTLPVAVSNFPATQPVSVATLPLPTNAAQETGGHLASIDAKLANPLPVTGTFFQATQPVSEIDGSNVTLGAKADAAQIDSTQTASLMSIIKGLLSQCTSLLTKFTAAIGSQLTAVSLSVSQATDAIFFNAPAQGASVFASTTNPLPGGYTQLIAASGDTVTVICDKKYNAARIDFLTAVAGITFNCRYSVNGGVSWTSAYTQSTGSGTAPNTISVASGVIGSVIIEAEYGPTLQIQVQNTTTSPPTGLNFSVTPIQKSGRITQNVSVGGSIPIGVVGSNADAATASGNPVRIAGASVDNNVRSFRTDLKGAVITGRSDKPTFSYTVSALAAASSPTPLIVIESGTTKRTIITKITLDNVGDLGITAAKMVNYTVFRTTAAGSSGSVTPQVRDSGDTFSGIVRAGSFTPGSAGVKVLDRWFYVPTGVLSAVIPINLDLPLSSQQKGIVLPAGVANGIVIRVENGDANLTNIYLTVEWTEE